MLDKCFTGMAYYVKQYNATERIHVPLYLAVYGNPFKSSTSYPCCEMAYGKVVAKSRLSCIARGHRRSATQMAERRHWLDT